MSEKMFPERQRCLTCRKKLEDVVIDGLYCSYRCGGFPEPYGDDNIESAPRMCRTMRNGRWAWKKRWRCESEVPERIKSDPATNIYRCSHCHYLHVGHDRALETEQARTVSDESVFADVLVRIRNGRGQSVKDVAAAINVRPIRVKEVESGKEFDPAVLFKMLHHYRVRLQILFRE